MAELRDLLFELGSEELPPKSLLTLSQALADQVRAGLDKAGLAHGSITAYATPRRLALWVRELVTMQPDQTVERRGPAVAAAYQADGTPSKALEGFLRSTGATPEQLQVTTVGKNAWVSVSQHIAGEASENLIPDILQRALAALPIAKRMRWGQGVAEFVRPVHWVVLLWGNAVIPARILDLETGRDTRGHRFHHPDRIRLDNPADYAVTLQATGQVIAGFAERRELIRQAAMAEAARVGGIAHIEDDLLDEVTALVEWPVPITGSFEARFLALPPEALITTLQANQKYFPVKDASGQLLPWFITFSNIASRNPATVQAGNERVVRPRLADAEFFWNQDRRQSLDSRVPALASITFQKTLGSVLDKTRRVQALAVVLAERLSLDPAPVARAAWLAKADLLSNMVGEFPELQGIMGRHYALADGEPADVAQAIEEQYLPKLSGGVLPQTDTGRVLAVAEKLDTLTGIFSAGLIPGGDKDPYALRRAALGIIRIQLETGQDTDLGALIECALDGFSHAFDRTAVAASVLDFMLERLRGYCLEKGYRPDEFDAVLALRPTRLPDFGKRLEAVKTFRQLPEADSLAAANKRIRNLLRKVEQSVGAVVDETALTEPVERVLLQAVRLAEAETRPGLASADYAAVLRRLSTLREPIDAFFDQVMVLCEDERVRQNRLALLSSIERLFLDIADIARLQG